MRRIGLLCVACTALALTSGVSASAPRANAPTDIIPKVTEADLEQIARDHGDTIDEVHLFENPSVRAKSKEGLLYVLIGTACDEAKPIKCEGIMMQVRYTADETVTAESILDANMHQAALASWWDKDDKTVGFTRYVVLDHGVTRQNIQANIDVLLALAPAAMKYAFPG
ncbi:MAG: hypothetical protein ACAH11_12785 [Sphingomonas sp.]